MGTIGSVFHGHVENRRSQGTAQNAAHVRNAIARFNQVKGVSDADRDAAWTRIKAAAKKFDVEISETSWREIGKD